MKADYEYKEDTYIIKEEPKIIMGEARLLQAILCQAMVDIEKGASRDRESAVRWVMSDNNDLLELCLFVSKISKRDIVDKINEHILKKVNKLKPLGEQLF